MMKLKLIQPSRDASHGKLESASLKGPQGSFGDEHPHRVWSLLLPPGYFPGWK